MKTGTRHYIPILIALLVAIVTCQLTYLNEGQDPQNAGNKKKSDRIASLPKPAERSRAPEVLPVQREPVTIHKSIEGAPAWAIAYGKEFWRRASEMPLPASSNPSQPGVDVPENINLKDIMQRVSHAFRPAMAAYSVEARGQSYNARFDTAGMHLAPFRLLGERTETDFDAVLDSQDSEVPTKRIPLLDPDPTHEMTLRTISVHAGDEVLFSGATESVTWSVLGNTVQGLLNEERGIIEHYEAAPNGVEVTWILQSRPSQPGHVAINCELTGPLTHAGAATAGNLYADEEGNLRLRFGNAVAVDAAGVRTELDVYANGNALQITVPSELVATASFPLAIDPTFGPVTLVTGSDQDNPSVAWNGTHYLVAWSQSIGINAGQQNSRVFATRVSTSGVAQDLGGIPFSASSHTQTRPQVASSGSSWLVVWEQSESPDSAPSGNNADIRACLVANSGSVTKQNFSVANVALENERFPSVGGNAGGYLVAWHTTESGTGNKAVNLDQSGNSGTIVWVAQGLSVFGPRVAGGASDFLIAWYDSHNSNHEYWVARWSGAGIVNTAMADSFTTSYANPFEPALSYSAAAGRFLMLYVRHDGYYVRRIQTTPTFAVENYYRVKAIDVTHARAPLLACRGNDALAVWYSMPFDQQFNPAQVYGAIFSAGSPTSDPPSFSICIISPDVTTTIGVASDGNGYLLTMPDHNPTSSLPAHERPHVVYGYFLSAAGATDCQARTLIFVAPTPQSTQTYPTVAASFDKFLIAWADNRNSTTSGYDIFAAHVSVDGSVLEPDGISIVTASNDQTLSAVTSDNSDFLVVWQDKRSGSQFDLYCRKVIGSGASVSLSTESLVANGPASSSQTDPSVAWSSSAGQYIVVWADSRQGQGDIFGKVVNSAGTPVNPEIQIGTDSAKVEGGPKIASDGNDFLVVWRKTISVNDLDIYGRRLLASGTVNGGAIGLVVKASTSQKDPGLAYGPGGYFLTWVDINQIYGGVINTDPTSWGQVPIGGFIISNSSAPGAKGRPCVASDGLGFLVMWIEDRGQGTGVDVYARFTTAASGGAPDGAEFAVDTSNGSQYIGTSSSTPNCVAFCSVRFLATWFSNAFLGSSKVVAKTISR